MWAAPHSAAAAAVARGGSGPGRAGPGWSRSGGRRRRRERVAQRRTEPPRPRPAPAPGDAPPQAAASAAAAAAAAAGTEQVRRGGAGQRAGRGSGRGLSLWTRRARAWLPSQRSLLQRPLPAVISAGAGTVAYTAWAASEAWTGSLPPSPRTHPLPPVFQRICSSLLNSVPCPCGFTFLSPLTSRSQLCPCVHNLSPLSSVPRSSH